LVGWWPPIVLPLLVPVSQAADQGAKRPPWSADFVLSTARGRRRLHRVRLIVWTLRAFGVLLLLWIAVAIPLATDRFGVYGLVSGIVQAFVIALLMAFGAALGLRWLGMKRREVLRTSLPLLSPFTAPRACELVTAAAVRDLDPLARTAAVFGESRFLLWIRPWAYDELHARPGELDTVAALVRSLPRTVLEQAVRIPPAESAHRYCPRCARTYRDEITTCHECDALALVRA
jgi:hypothetical protein